MLGLNVEKKCKPKWMETVKCAHSLINAFILMDSEEKSSEILRWSNERNISCSVAPFFSPWSVALQPPPAAAQRGWVAPLLSPWQPPGIKVQLRWVMPSFKVRRTTSCKQIRGELGANSSCGKRPPHPRVCMPVLLGIADMKKIKQSLYQRFSCLRELCCLHYGSR